MANCGVLTALPPFDRFDSADVAFDDAGAPAATSEPHAPQLRFRERTKASSRDFKRLVQ